MSNTITAYFKGRIGVAESVYQNDYGIVMAFDAIYLPAHFDCYFSVPGSDTSIPAVGADHRVVIPNSVLEKAGNMSLHIPLHTGSSDSEVEYVAYFKVIGRARPEDDGTPAQMTAVERAIALLSQPITNIEEIVNEALSFTGDTFAEMKQELADDFAEYKGDVDDDIADFKTEIRGDIADVEHDFDVLDGQFQTAVAALTVDSEVQGIRTGDDGVTYTTAGEAVRKQFSDVKSEINKFESDTSILVEPINLLNPNSVLIGYNRPWNTPSSLVENANKVTFDYLPVEGGKLIYFDRGNLTKQTPDNFVEWDINKTVLVANADCPRTLNANTKYLSISIAKTTYDAWKNTLQLEYGEMRTFTPYFDPFRIIKEKTNKNCLSIAHQGYSADGAPYGYSKVESYINASKYGFDYGETDLVFSSDEVAMCCHDASFVDATSGSTIVISQHTASELQTYDYYGGTIATFDEVVKTCKENGIGLVVDHVTEADSGTRFANVMATVNKYQMQDNIIWLVGRESMITTLKTWYKKVKIYIPLSSKSNESIVVSLAQRTITDYNEVGLSLNAEVYSISDIIALVATLAPNIHIQCWTIDNADTYKNYLPYVSGITSNKYSTSLI